MSAVVVATVTPEPFSRVSEANGKGTGVEQVGAGPEQATTVPLTVAVTFMVTEIVNIPSTAAPVLSNAETVIVPLDVPGTILAALTFTLSVLPLPLSSAGGVRTSHALLLASPTAVQVMGREHLPVALSDTFCAVDDV